MSKKVIDLREVTSFEGLVALGVDTIKNESVQVPLEFVKQGADSAIAAAQSAVAATQAAATATTTANTATSAALAAAATADAAAKLANIEALTQAAVKAAEDANKATVNADTATKAANTATNAANTAVGAIDDKIAPKLNTPTTNVASTAAIRNLVGQTSSGTPVRVSPSQLRALVGVDHSILTEQIVPGEYWPDENGQPKQVYCQTFKGHTNENSYTLANLGLSVAEVSVVRGWVMLRPAINPNAEHYFLNIPLTMMVPASNPVKVQHQLTVGIDVINNNNIVLEGETMFDKQTPKTFSIMKSKYSLTLKYIKK